MSAKRRINLTLTPGIRAHLDELVARGSYSSASVLIEELVRERYKLEVAAGRISSPSSAQAARQAARDVVLTELKRRAKTPPA